MHKTNKILIGAIIILVIALGVVVYWQKGGFESPYYAVYLSTGDIYFGHLSYFPKYELTDVWLLQKDSSNQQNPFSLVKFDKAFWGPEDSMKLNSNDIIWTSELKSDSPVVQAIKNPQALNQATQNQAQTPLESTSTSK